MPRFSAHEIKKMESEMERDLEKGIQAPPLPPAEERWHGVKSTINVEAVAAEEKRLGRSLTYTERRQLSERLRAAAPKVVPVRVL